MATTLVERPEAGAPVDEAAPRGVTLSTLGGLVVVIAGFFIGLQPLRDNSFLTHLATGRLILDTGSVPSADPYSWTAHGEAWTVQSWLASVAYALLEDAAGLVGVRLLIAVASAGLAWALWRLTQPAGAVVVRLALVVLVLLIGYRQWTERPLLFGLLALALVHVLANGNGRAWLAAPLFAVWVNVHGSFPLGGLLLVLLVAGRWLDREPVRREATVLGWAVAGLALGALNPLGIRLVFFPIEMFQKMDQLREIREWQPVDLGQMAAQVLIGLAIVGVIAFARHRSWRSILPAVVFFVAAVLGARNVAPASIVMLAAIAPCLRGIGRDEGLEHRPVFRLAAAALLAVAGLAAVSSLRGPDVDLQSYPVAAVDWMASEGHLTPESRLVSRDYAGNFLEAHSGTEIPVFIDDRYDMYPPDVVDDYRVLNHDEEGWEEVLDRRGATALLWTVESDLADMIHDADGWDVVYEDDEWLVALPA